MNKKIIISVIAIVVFIVAGISWRQMRPIPKYTGSIEKVVIADDIAILHVIAQEKGFFRENGLDAQITRVTTGIDSMNALLQGKVDIAPATDFVGVNKMYGNKNLRIFGQQSKGIAPYIIARKDKGINQPADLKGKIVGLTEKTYTEFFFDQFLIANDLSLKDVTIVDLPPVEIADQMEKGQVDAVITWEPYTYNIRKKIGDNAITWQSQSSQKFFFLSYSTDEFIRTHPLIIERYLRAMIQTVQYVKDNPTDAKDIFAKKYHYDDAYMEYLWMMDDFNIGLDQALFPQMENMARFLIENKLIDQTEVPNYLDYIYIDAMEKIKPDAVTIIR